MTELIDQATFGALMFSAGYLSRELIIFLDRTVVHRVRHDRRTSHPTSRPT